MCLLRSRVRSPSSAGRALCRERPGRSGGGGTSGSLSRQAERESRGEALTAVCISHRVSAGPDGPNLVPHRRTRGRIRFLR